MTPGARVAAAIDVLDQIGDGAATEQALTSWARSSRFAGSKDRAAVRDYVFSVQRCRRSIAAIGGGETGRALMLGLLRQQDLDLAVYFNGEGYGAAVLSEEETAALSVDNTLSDMQKLDVPDWLEAPLRSSLGDDFEAVAALLQTRAPVFVRVNSKKANRADVQAELAEDGIETRVCALVDTALEAVKNPRRVQQNEAYKSGRAEVQDLASQYVAAQVPLQTSQRVLDYCAGGGGKSLALAARGDYKIFAHDLYPNRMRDLPARALRAGEVITVLSTAELAEEDRFDVVVCDVPCSGSGAWRRSPDGKWGLTEDSLSDLVQTQAQILDKAVDFVKPDGTLAYATCSLFEAENRDQITGFLERHPDWKLVKDDRLTPMDGGDGFFLALLTKS